MVNSTVNVRCLRPWNTNVPGKSCRSIHYFTSIVILLHSKWTMKCAHALRLSKISTHFSSIDGDLPVLHHSQDNINQGANTTGCMFKTTPVQQKYQIVILFCGLRQVFSLAKYIYLCIIVPLCVLSSIQILSDLSFGFNSFIKSSLTQYICRYIHIKSLRY